MRLLDIKIPPIKPGVYQFKDVGGQIIYIGKAKNLRNRVRTYFNNLPKFDVKTKQLVENIADIDYTITDNELEALILESALIKKYKPKYNIRLRDDKNYQFIKIDYSLPIAKIYSTRTKDDLSASGSAKYFGPFTSGLNVKNTIRLIKRIFPYCQAEKIGARPCFNYQLHRCPGVCLGLVSPENYKESFSQIELFLQGKNEIIKKELLKKMKTLSKKALYEKAVILRDQLRALDALSERQKVISPKSSNQDYISLYKIRKRAAINLFLVRSGRLLAKENMLMENIEEKSDGEIISAFVERYYLDTTNLPSEILLQTKVGDKSLFVKLLQNRYFEIFGKSKNIKIKVPKIGTAKKLLRLGNENAKNFLEQQLALFENEKTALLNGLNGLKGLLNMKKIPKRIECYDISNISGKSAVGSMVVFSDGKPDKTQYRKFKIRAKSTPDDYSMMSEILSRRLGNDWKRADLWVIDGGRGQLNAALDILKKYKLQIPAIALGKSRSEPKEVREEKIFMPQKSEPIVLGEGNPALTILQRLRDEAHRFAITYHRNVRSRELFEN